MQNKQDVIRGRIWQCMLCTGLLAFFLSSCIVLKSDLTVQPGARFELGGNRNGSFTVQVRNAGEVPAMIIERKANGQRVDLGVIAPGNQKRIRFSPGAAALINNTSAKPARLFLTVSGDTDLAMREQ